MARAQRGRRRSCGAVAAANAAVAVTTLLASACGSSSSQSIGESSIVDSSPPTVPEEVLLPTPVQQLDIDGTEYTFEITPDGGAGLQPGWTLVNFDNVGVEPHQVMFARLKPDADMAELAEAGAGDSSGAAAIEFVDMIGGVSYIDAGHDTKALVNLPEALVMAMCYVPTPDGVAHGLLGMTNSLNVVDGGLDAAAEDAVVEDLSDARVVGIIEFSEEGYVMPENMVAGWYHVTNTSSALHELALLKMDRALSEREAEYAVEQLAANEIPDVELDAVGGMGAVSAGFDGYLYLDLDPGEYLAVDFMPDPGDPRPHMLDGYWGLFTV